MPRIIQPVVSPRGRVIVLTGATLWLVAAMVLSAVPDGASAAPSSRSSVTTAGAARIVERLDGTDELLYFPRMIADRRGGLFVADRGSHRVVRVDTSLRAETIFGREGAGPGEMQLPYDVAVDSEGNVFVVDIQLRRINKFTAEGRFIKSVAVPGVATLLIDSHDQLIVYPAPGEALMQRYSNDLVPGETLLAKAEERMHRMRMGVLMALDGRDRLFVLDQVDLTMTVYGRDMQPITRWTVEAPGVRASIDAGIASMLAKDPASNPRVPGFQAMALDPRGDHLAFSYIVRPEFGDNFTRVAWYSVQGRFLGSEDRTDSVYANALLPDGRLVESTAEALHIFSRQPLRTSRGN